ncbi:hypothetical protein AAKU52_002098 [Pedobacter sp. CG_S7]
MSQILTWAMLILCIGLLVNHFMDIKNHDDGQ